MSRYAAKYAYCVILRSKIPRKSPEFHAMAVPIKTAQGTWRIQIDIAGVRKSKTLPTRREVVVWALSRENEIREGGRTTKTVADALKKYSEEVSEHHRGWAKEQIRLAAFVKQDKFPAKMRLADLKPSHIAEWRDARLAVNARGSVLRDLGLLSAVMEAARREWQWITVNPVRDVRKPAEPDHRNRLITGPEIRLMLRQLGHTRGSVRTVSQAVAMAFLLALSTGMRAGEIAGLTWTNVSASFVTLPMTKNGTLRNVPLSPVGRRLIERMRGWDDTLVFGLGSQTLDALFRKARVRAGLAGFTFHDSRHVAATRIGKSGRWSLPEMCLAFGWKNPKMAMTYINISASDLAKKLV